MLITKIKFTNGMIPLPQNYATVKNPKTGQVKIGKVGFSFTTLIFDLLPSIFRNDWYNLLCMVATDAIFIMAVAVTIHQSITQVAQQVLSFTSIFWAFFYNMMYFRHLSNRGFVPTDKHSKQLLLKNNYIKS